MQFKNILTRSFNHASTIIFIFGFIFDMIMLPEFEEALARYIGLAHICIIALFIIFREWLVSRNKADNFEQKMFSFSTFIISFSSGAALSFIFIYAIRSAAFSVSWPLFLILTLCMLANEAVSTHNFRLTLDVAVLFIASLFFIIFNAPLFLKVQNDNTFLLSLVISSVVSFVYVHLFLKNVSHTGKYESPRAYALSFGIPMFVGMLYFLNLIPAVPLSLHDSGIYHKIVKTEDGDFYALKEEDARMFAKYRRTKQHLQETDSSVYYFSKIESPAEVAAPIYHVWEYFDKSQNKWKESLSIAFNIQGGREDGYRAYSKKENITPGLWRITIKVGENRVIGREKFEVIKGGTVKIKEVSL